MQYAATSGFNGIQVTIFSESNSNYFKNYNDLDLGFPNKEEKQA